MIGRKQGATERGKSFGTNSWHVAEKSNLMHDMCGVGKQGERDQQEGQAEEQRRW